jgi:hypothetical protein
VCLSISLSVCPSVCLLVCVQREETAHTVATQHKYTSAAMRDQRGERDAQGPHLGGRAFQGHGQTVIHKLVVKVGHCQLAQRPLCLLSVMRRNILLQCVCVRERVWVRGWVWVRGRHESVCTAYDGISGQAREGNVGSGPMWGLRRYRPFESIVAHGYGAQCSCRPISQQQCPCG